MNSEVLTLPFAAAAARTARIRVVQLLADTQACAGPTVEIVALLTSELVANAVLHGTPPLELRIDVTDGVVRVEVHDSNRAEPRRRNPHRTEADGRGLAIIEALATRWGTEPVDDGKVVWFELSA